jgi:hypothetical protein
VLVKILYKEIIVNWYKRCNKKEPTFSAELKNNDGFYFLDIPQSFATGLYRMLKDEVDETPYKQKGYNQVGAHVSVINEEEFEEPVDIKEVGKFFDFTIIGAKQTNPAGWDEMSQVYFMEIECPKIEKMRESYGLSKTYQDKGHNFHITFAVDKK